MDFRTSEIEPPVVGIAIFSDVNNPKRGVAAVSGGSAFAIQTAGDLDTDVLWITNLSFKEALAARLISIPKLRTKDFFRVDLARIASEVGVSLERYPSVAAQVISGIADRCMKASWSFYQFDTVAENLKRTIEPCIITHKEQAVEPKFQGAIHNALKSFQLCHDVQPPDGKPYVLRFNRVWFAKKVISFPTPAGQWQQISLAKHVTNQEIRRGQNSITYKFLCELIDSRPALVKISVKHAQPEIANFIDFAIGTDGRDWIPAHEAAQVAFYADVTVKEVLVAERYCNEGEALGVGLTSLDAVQETSFSHGLMAENHLHAIYSPRKFVTGNQTKWYTPTRATWWRAWDRMICLKAAIKLGNAGFFVRGYGTGAVRVVVTDSQIKSLEILAGELQLTAPLEMGQTENDLLSDENKHMHQQKVHEDDVI